MARGGKRVGAGRKPVPASAKATEEPKVEVEVAAPTDGKLVTAARRAFADANLRGWTITSAEIPRHVGLEAQKGMTRIGFSAGEGEDPNEIITRLVEKAEQVDGRR